MQACVYELQQSEFQLGPEPDVKRLKLAAEFHGRIPVSSETSPIIGQDQVNVPQHRNENSGSGRAPFFNHEQPDAQPNMQ